MWGDIVVAALGVLAAVAGANLLSGWQGRARKAMREEAELLAQLPSDLENRAALAEYLAESVQVYVDRARSTQNTLNRLQRRVLVLKILLGALVAGGGAIVLWAVSAGVLLTFATWQGRLMYTIFAAGLPLAIWIDRTRRQIELRQLPDASPGPGPFKGTNGEP